MGRHSKEVRSYNMSRIRSTNTKPEEKVRKYLFAQGFRYRKNVRKLPGCPDIVLAKYRTVIFVNGCFWHMHEGCSKFVLPQTNIEYWENKLLKNRERDAENKNKLEATGWNVVTVWECELKKDKEEETLKKLCGEILKNRL
ncbi:MAG TPA: very short patch repair endonuclease [Eubacteriaceae bacterium]|nr:very short patch repair endonuclease [Eubacteriaceae bacterium]